MASATHGLPTARRAVSTACSGVSLGESLGVRPGWARIWPAAEAGERAFVLSHERPPSQPATVGGK